MAIEFCCGQCGNWLRTTDDTAGRQAKCPVCGSLVPIPDAGPGASPVGVGKGPLARPAATLPQTTRAAQTGTPTTPAPTPKPNPNPYASPTAAVAPIATTDATGSRNGPAWERDGPSVNSFIATLRDFYSSLRFFADMRREGSLGPPLGFGMLGGAIGLLFALGISFVVSSLMSIALRDPALGNRDVATQYGLLFALSRWLILGPALTIGYLFGGAGAYHLALLAIGGAPQPYPTTFRVVAYAAGAVAPIALVLCGQNYILVVVHLVYVIIGLVKAQEVSGVKATAAVLVPWLVCCCTCFSLVIFFGLVAVGIGRPEPPRLDRRHFPHFRAAGGGGTAGIFAAPGLDVDEDQGIK